MENKSTFDFQDGNGPVPAHHHVNPDGSEGGWVAETAVVSGNAHISGDTYIYGNAHIYGDVRLTKGFVFATKYNDWQVTEIDNGDGTTTLYANAEFEAVEAEELNQLPSQSPSTVSSTNS